MDGVQQKLEENERSVDDGGELEGKVDVEASEKEKLAPEEYLTTITSLLKEKKLEEGLNVCNNALARHSGNTQLLERKVKILCQLYQFHDAFAFVNEWIKEDPNNVVAKREQKRLKIILSAVEDQDLGDEVPEDGKEKKSQETNIEAEQDVEKADASQPSGTSVDSEERVTTDEVKIPSTSTKGSIFKVFKQPLSPEKNGEDKVSSLAVSSGELNLTQREELGHVLQRERQSNSPNWHHRAPPRGLASDEYGLCKRFIETGRCTFGEKCTRAHSEAELEEWNRRYAVRKQQLQQSMDARAHGGTYIELLWERLMCQEQPKTVLVENLEFVKIHVNSDLKVSMSTKKCMNAWTFTVTSKLCLNCVALLINSDRSYFHISSISVGPRKTQKYQNLENLCQEWINQDTVSKTQGEFVYRAKVVFKTDIYGTYRQSIVFDFGVEAILMRVMQVESAPATDPEKIRKEITLTEAHRWNEQTVTLVHFEPRPESNSESEIALMSKYVLPRPDKISVPETLMHALSKDNYRLWMHEMLYIEEMAQLGYISRFNVTTNLQLVNRFLLMPSALSAAKYAQGGELFARLKLEDDLSEDSMAGRLILQSSNVAWVAKGKKERPDKVYVAVIEDKGKNFIFMRLSKSCVDDLGLTCDQEFYAQIQFQLNRLPMCEMHSAVDRLPTLDIVFPNLDRMPDKLELDDSILQHPSEKKRLNDKQKDAVRTILASRDLKLTPLLIVGPFGTGKTFTMAHAAKQVLKQEETRILICTHSNSAADLYIKEFLHDYVQEGHPEVRPLRVMYKFRWIQTVPEVVIDYTLLERKGPMAGTFRMPAVEDIMAHRVIITTLKSARYVVDLDLPKEAFSHIFIDEAAQSLESETLIPLSVAHEKTRIVFAGDHMQMSPEVYSDFTRQQGFHTSLLERLHELYPQECVYKVMLCENYRSHAAIIDFTSELFYDNKLISCGDIQPHEQFYPLTFYAAKGEEIQHENSTGFYNMSEVYEIVERVDELKKKWPEAWGSFDDNGLSIMAPYSDQVARIRMELRKRKLYSVNVERVMNVQGKQYRVIVLSITRTRLTCRSDPNMEEYLDFGFLSNIKLLNTAITRAQSLVIVVGDPVSVCLVGKCRKIWEYFLEICHSNDSLHGIAWVPLKEQLDRAELTKSFVLNPLAPEFVPTRYQGVQVANQIDHGSVFQSSNPHVMNWGYHGAGMVPSQAIQQMYPAAVYQQQMYLPPNPGLLPSTMYYPQTLGRGLVPNRSMFSRFIPQGGGFPLHRPGDLGRDAVPRMVAMPGARALRQPRGRHMYYSPPRVSFHPSVPQAYPPSLIQSHHYPAGGNYLYQFPDDPRALAYPAAHSPAALHPYLAPQAALPGLRQPVGHYGGFAPHPSLTYAPQHPGFLPLHASPGHGIASRDRSDTADSSGSGRQTDSPNSNIQLLPNVKHVPAHLLGKSGEMAEAAVTTAASSTSENVGLNSQFTREERIAQLSNRPYSPANYPRERTGPDIGVHQRSNSPASTAHIRERALSDEDAHPRPSFSPADNMQDDGRNSAEEKNSGHDRSLSLSPPATTTSLSSVGSMQEHNVSRSSLNNRRQRPILKLRTGFSRQYSDDLPTPTVITNMIQMIDENVDEMSAEDSPSPQTVPPESKTNLKLRMTVAQQLQHRQATESSGASSSSTPPSTEDSQPSYASMVSKMSEHSQPMTAEEATQLELQTPRTPKGFMTPGADMEIDPFGILKSLNIGGTPQ